MFSEGWASSTHQFYEGPAVSGTCLVWQCRAAVGGLQRVVGRGFVVCFVGADRASLPITSFFFAVIACLEILSAGDQWRQSPFCADDRWEDGNFWMEACNA